MKIIIKIIGLILLISIELSAQFQFETSNYPNQLTSVSDIDFANPNTGYVIGELDHSSAKLYKTTDKGASWNLRKDFGNIQNHANYAAPKISFINANTGWAIFGYFVSSDMFTDYFEIQKTTNGGISWQVVLHSEYPAQERICGTIKFINESTGYLINSWTGDFMKSTNSGTNWSTIKIAPLPPPNPSIKFTTFLVSPLNPSKIYLGGVKFGNQGNNSPLFYVSNDAGANFQTIFDGSSNPYDMKGINNLTLVNNNNTDFVRLATNSQLFKYNDNPQNPFTQISTLPTDFYDLSFSGLDKGFARPSNNPNIVYRTENQGLTWVAENLPTFTYATSGNPFMQFGNILYVNGIPNVTRKLGMNLSILYDNVNSSGSFSFDGANKDIPSSPTMHYLRGGNSILNAASILSENQTDEKIFYSWNFGSMNNYVNNYYFENVGDIKASYKTKLKADNQWAINNANQTKAIRDTTNLINNNPLNLIHQVHESIGGIFYTRSTNGGTNWSREEVVNYSLLSNDALGNTNPSITIKRRDLKPLTIDDQERNVAVVWERYNQSNGKIEVLTADRVLKIIPGTGYEWKRTEYENGNTIFTSFDCSSDPSFKSTPKIFVSSPLTDLRNSIVIVPHLEKVNSTGKVKVILTIRNLYNKFDYVVDNGEDGLISNLAVSSPYNSYDVFDLNIVYQKDNTINNIVYKKVRAGKDSNFGLFALTLETEGNLGNGDGMRARFSPDISVQNGLPVVTYCGNYYDNRIIQYEDETVGDNMLSLTKHTTITRFKTTNNGAWSEYERFTGLNPQENPNVEGSKNAMAYLLSFRKNGTYFQYVRINGLQQPYYCNPGSYSETDAKFVRGSYIGQFGSYINPSLLTLSDPDNSRFTIDERSFSIDPYSNGTDGYNNLDGIIEKDNTQYSLTLGPIIASNTTYGFEDDTPPQTVQNPVEFNETMVSAVFSLSNYDTLILGAHGKYATSFGQSMQPLKYHVNLVNATSGQIHRELFRDTINVEDSVGIEFLRGYVINNIDKGTDQFYIQMIVDTVDAGDGDYNMAGVYADDTPPQGDAPINYKTKVFFENGSNSLTSGNQIPKEYSLSQNYPNPFNPSTTIKYSLPKDGFVSLKIYDITGREVKSLAGEVKKAGYYSVTFNASSLASGVYFYRIQSNDFVMTKRMVLIK